MTEIHRSTETGSNTGVGPRRPGAEETAGQKSGFNLRATAMKDFSIREFSRKFMTRDHHEAAAMYGEREADGIEEPLNDDDAEGSTAGSSAKVFARKVAGLQDQGDQNNIEKRSELEENRDAPPGGAHKLTDENPNDQVIQQPVQLAEVTESVTERVTEKVTESVPEPGIPAVVVGGLIEEDKEGGTDASVIQKVAPVVTETITEIVVTEPVTERVTEPATEKVTEPVTEIVVTEKVTESVTETVVESVVSEPVTEETVIIEKPTENVFQYKFDPTLMVEASKIAQGELVTPSEECRRQPNDDDAKVINNMAVWDGAQLGTPRILCAVYTYSKKHVNVQAIKESWASRCDGFVAFSDVTDESIPTFGIKHDGREDYANMWQKSRSIWKYIHHWYRDDYDWFLLGGDDMFIVIENFRYYVLSEEIQSKDEPLYLGMRFQTAKDMPYNVVFNSGGAGTYLNRKALDVLASHLDSDECSARETTFAEDVNVAKCLRLSGVVPYDTKDALGRERFHPFTPGGHLTYRIPDPPDWYARYTFDLKLGHECCSEHSISYHYINPPLMEKLWHLLYTCRRE